MAEELLVILATITIALCNPLGQMDMYQGLLPKPPLYDSGILPLLSYLSSLNTPLPYPYSSYGLPQAITCETMPNVLGGLGGYGSLKGVGGQGGFGSLGGLGGLGYGGLGNLGYLSRQYNGMVPLNNGLPTPPINPCTPNQGQTVCECTTISPPMPISPMNPTICECTNVMPQPAQVCECTSNQPYPFPMNPYSEIMPRPFNPCQNLPMPMPMPMPMQFPPMPMPTSPTTVCETTPNILSMQMPLNNVPMPISGLLSGFPISNMQTPLPLNGIISSFGVM